MITPIKPSDIVKKLPDEVIEVFNEVIQEKWDGHSSIIRHCDVVPRICSKMNIKAGKLFDKGYLDVELVFRQAGWKVEYDKPGYNETYDATWTFSKKR